jgi:hypothetical protein
VFVPAAVVRDEVLERRLQEVPEPTAVGVGPAEVAADEPQRELLTQILRHVAVADARQQVAEHRAVVPAEEDFLRLRRVRAVGVGALQQIPAGADAADP